MRKDYCGNDVLTSYEVVELIALAHLLARPLDGRLSVRTFDPAWSSIQSPAGSLHPCTWYHRDVGMPSLWYCWFVSHPWKYYITPPSLLTVRSRLLWHGDSPIPICIIGRHVGGGWRQYYFPTLGHRPNSATLGNAAPPSLRYCCRVHPRTFSSGELG